MAAKKAIENNENIGINNGNKRQPMANRDINVKRGIINIYW